MYGKDIYQIGAAINRRERVTYTTSGSVRGCCGHKHRSIETAFKCLRKDQRGCAAVYGYSDRVVVAIDADGDHRKLTWREREALGDCIIEEAE